MISVLIPVFNNDLTGMVHALKEELASLSFTAEIILLDDGSEESFRATNRKLAQLPHVRYEEGEQNLGRSLVRPKLAGMAQYPYLLFLDGDSRPVHNHFLQNYAEAVPLGGDVWIGGRNYEEQPPSDCAYRLHWKYGRSREYSGKDDSSPAYKGGFQTNNFLIRKEVFEQLEPVPLLTGYGHEDTWIGIQLEQLPAQIRYLNNPILHAGLETGTQFLLKSENALRNMLHLEQLAGRKSLKEHVKLYRFYNHLCTWKHGRMYSLLFGWFRKRVRRNLLSCHPSLFLFDLYRLDELLRMGRNFNPPR